MLSITTYSTTISTEKGINIKKNWILLDCLETERIVNEKIKEKNLKP